MALRKPPNAGDLKHRIDLQIRSQTQDSLGGVVNAWETVATLWAAIRHRAPAAKSGEVDLTQSGGPAPVERVEFVIRFRADVHATTHRIRLVRPGVNAAIINGYAYDFAVTTQAASLYDITHVNDVGGCGQWMVLTCEIGANRG